MKATVYFEKQKQIIKFDFNIFVNFDDRLLIEIYNQGFYSPKYELLRIITYPVILYDDNQFILEDTDFLEILKEDIGVNYKFVGVRYNDCDYMSANFIEKNY